MNIYSPTAVTKRMIEKFKPTRLAIKELAGVLYFCKSINEDIYKYTGSGVVWRARIKKYGKENINTLWVSDWYYDPREIQQIALHFSEENQIVESSTWANQKPENGLDGGTTSEIQNKPERLQKNKKSAESWWANSSEQDRKTRIANMTVGLNEPGIQQKKSSSLKQTLASPAGKKKNKESLRVARASEAWKEKVYDHTIYEFNHRDGRVEVCTRNELIKKYDLNRQNVSSMILKRRYKSVGGWKLVK